MNVATSEAPAYQPMSTYRIGEKAILLTYAGVAVIGAVDFKGRAYGYVAWSPLPKIPPDIKALLNPRVQQ